MGDVGRPEFGGRFTLMRGSHGDEQVHYGVVLWLPDSEWTGELSIDLADGSVVRSADWSRAEHAGQGAQADGAEEPPGWLLEQVRAALRSYWRAWSKARQGSVAEPVTAHFPRRVTRWRAEPEVRVEVAARRLTGEK